MNKFNPAHCINQAISALVTSAVLYNFLPFGATSSTLHHQGIHYLSCYQDWYFVLEIREKKRTLSDLAYAAEQYKTKITDVQIFVLTAGPVGWFMKLSWSQAFVTPSQTAGGGLWSGEETF